MTDFVVSRWLESGHLQTMGTALPLWSPPRGFVASEHERVRIPLAEGGALVGHAWWASADPGATAILVHGVGGSSESKYMIRAAVAFHRAGVHVVRLNMRGAGEGIEERPTTLYHAGLTEDLLAAASMIARHRRVSSVSVVGFSLGGNVALKLAGEIGDRATSVDAVAALSAPLDLEAVSTLIERWKNLPYKAYILRNLLAQARAFAEIHPTQKIFDPRALRGVRSVRAYDDLVIAPMHGFANAADYYAKTSAGPFLASVKVPTLLLHAEDDPLVPGHTVRPHLASAPPTVEAHVSQRGGHVAWVEGFGEKAFTETWAIRRTIDFVKKAARA